MFARRAGSTAAFEAHSVVVGYTLQVAGVTLGAGPSSPQFVGTVVTFTGSVTGGLLSYEYQFWGRAAGAPSFSLAQDYGPLNTFTWNTASVPPGNYEWQVFARRVGSTAAFEAQSALVVYTLQVGGVTLVAGPPSPQFVGTVVTFTGSVTGGLLSYEYQFWGRARGAPSFSLAQDYSPLNTFTWNTASVPLGNYEWQVFARRAGSTAASETQSTMLIFQLVAGQR